MNYRNMGVSFIAALVLAGCGIPLSRTSIIPKGVAKNPKELASKLTLLQKDYKGKDVNEVLAFLNIKPHTPGIRDIVDAKEKKEVLYPGISITGSPEEADRFVGKLAKYDVKEIVYSDITKRFTLDSPISALISKDGTEFKAYLIFYESKLQEVRSPSNFTKEEKSRSYITDLFGDAFGQGLRHAR